MALMRPDARENLMTKLHEIDQQLDTLGDWTNFEPASETWKTLKDVRTKIKEIIQ